MAGLNSVNKCVMGAVKAAVEAAAKGVEGGTMAGMANSVVLLCLLGRASEVLP